MDASQRRAPRCLSSRALSAGDGGAGGAGDEESKAPERSSSTRTEAEALHAQLLRHRTLELQARLRGGAGSQTSLLGGDRGGAPGAQTDLLQLPSSLPGGTSRTAVGMRGAARPPGVIRGSAALTPEEELRGCFCGSTGNHRARTYTLADWLDTWGKELRSTLLHLGHAVFGGKAASASQSDAPAAVEQAPPPVVPMVAMAR